MSINMFKLIGLFALISGLFLSIAQGNPLTFELHSSKECVHIITPESQCKVTYYFAVQMGENNDYEVDYEIFGPDSTQALASKQRERQGEWEFIAFQDGEYSFCFQPSNTNNRKIIDFEAKYACPNYSGDSKFTENFLQDANKNYSPEDDKVISLLDDLDGQLNDLERNLEYYKTRNNRNQQTVESTERRIFWFSISALFLTGLITVGQSYLLEFVFHRSRKNKV